MASADYAPGGWFGIIRSETAVILGPESQPALVHKIWDLLAGGPEVHEVLHAVTGSLGVPLSRLPRFAIIGFRGPLRVFLRGDLQFVVQLEAGPVELDGRNVTTWTERLLDSPLQFTLTVPGSPWQELPGQNFRERESPECGFPESDSRVPGTGLPVSEGVVLLQALRADMTGTGSTDRPASPVEAPREALAQAPREASIQSSPEVSPETIAGPPETTFEAVSLDAAVLDVPALDVPAGRASEVTGSYDHLWDKTVMRSIEGAAVRTEEDPDDGPGAAGLVSAGPEPAGTVAPTADVPRSAAAPAPAPAPAGGPVGGGSIEGGLVEGGLIGGGLIDSVPWITAGDSGPRPSVPPSFISVPNPGQVPDPIPNADPVQAPNLIQAPAPQPAPQPTHPAEGDHDGQTVLKSDLDSASGDSASGRSGSAGAGAKPGGMLSGAPLTGPLVLARVCPGGHANPPTSGLCSTCGSGLPDVAVQVPRPRLGRVRLSTGEVIELEESLVVGRQPSVSRVQGGAMPRLVQVASPGGDISRSHVEIRLEGWHVMLCDLKATNGTVLVREGQPPRRLALNEMAIVLDGDIAELGDDVSLRFEEIL
jgi:hypothetical protein